MFDVTMKARDLKEALAFVKVAVESRHTIPILGNVLIRAEAATARISGTNLDVEASEGVNAVVSRAGAITIPHSGLTAFVGACAPDGDVRMWESVKATRADSDGRIHVECDGAEAMFDALPAADFPFEDGGMAFKGDTMSFYLPAAELVRPLKFALHCTSTEETRYYLNGVHITREGDALAFVATDGHRLACIEASGPTLAGGPALPPNVIVPTLACDAIIKAVGKDSNLTTVVITDKEGVPQGVAVHVGTRVVRSKLIDGAFPDWRRLDPQSARRYTVNRATLIKACDAMAKLNRGNSRAPGAKFMFSPHELRLSADGNSLAPIKGDFGAPPREFGFNVRYLSGLLRQFESDSVTIEAGPVQEFEGPVRIVESVDKPRPYALLMPLRV